MLVSSDLDHSDSGVPTSQTPTSDLPCTAVDVIQNLLTSWEEGDIYLRLSAAGSVVFVVLCGLICLAWRCYGSEILTVFDSRRDSRGRCSCSSDKLTLINAQAGGSTLTACRHNILQFGVHRIGSTRITVSDKLDSFLLSLA